MMKKTLIIVAIISLLITSTVLAKTGESTQPKPENLELIKIAVIISPIHTPIVIEVPVHRPVKRITLSELRRLMDKPRGGGN